MRYGPMGGGSGHALLFGVGGFICTLLVIGLITAFVIFLVKRSKRGPGHLGRPGPGFGHHPHWQPMPPALQILDERLARGEIEIADYVERKAAMLGEHPRPTEWTHEAEPKDEPES